MGDMRKLTAAQLRVLAEVNKEGFVVHKVSFGRSQSNRPAWFLADLGLVEFGWGPKDSFLKVQGFMPTDAGREHLKLLLEK